MDQELTDQTEAEQPQETPTEARETAGDIRKTAEFQEAIEDVFSRRLGREREKIRRELEAEYKSRPKGDSRPQVRPSNADRAIERRFEYVEAAADLGLSREQRKTLEPMFMKAAELDADPYEWIKATVSAFGSFAGTKPQASEHDTPKPSHNPPASDRGGPSSTPDAIRSADPERWDGPAVERIIAEGKDRAEGYQLVRKRFMEGLKGKRIVFTRRD